MYTGLSLDQAPPISVPFRFFLTAPIFGIILGLVFMFSPFTLVSNLYSPTSIAVIHLFTLGILTMIIFGAMQQMMPVLAGAIISRPRLFANIVHPSLVVGTLLFSFSFLFNIKMLLHLGIFFLSLAFLSFCFVAFKLLFKVEFLTSTVKAMRIFIICTLLTFLLGFYLAFSHMTSSFGENFYSFANMHMLFALLGFSLILIMGVSFQIIPMFYVALDFPKFYQHKGPLVLFILFLFLSFCFYFKIDTFLLKSFISIIIVAFAYLGLNSLNNRKRPVFDITLWYWKFSLFMLMISILMWLSEEESINYILAIIFAFGFLYSLLQGMVYKIIPFLSWFHLSSKGYFQIPTLREFIDEENIKIHFYLHIISIIIFILSDFINFLIILASLIFILSNILFIFNIITAINKYKKVLKTQEPMPLFKN